MAIVAAFSVIYLVWGSTFLAVRIAVQTLPPLGMAAMRFFVAGVILLAIGLRSQRPSLAHWRNAAIVGALFFVGNHSLLGYASRQLPSSLVSLIIATEVPIIALVSAAFLPNRPLTRRTVIGSVLGLLGVASLFVGVGGERPALLPSVMVLGASLSWSIGAVVSQMLSGPKDPVLRAGMQMTAGGMLLAVGSVALGESWAIEGFTPRAIGMLAYLIVFGSLLAFACYTWLLERVRTDAVATHVFVNPLVATALGVGFAGEHVIPAQIAAGVLIIASVLVITLQPKMSPKA